MSSMTTAPLTRDSRVWHSPAAVVSVSGIDYPHQPKSCSHRIARRRAEAFVFPGLRYLILVLGTLFLSQILGCVICFNPALTVMMDLHSSPLTNISAPSNSSSVPDFSSWSLPMAQRRFPFSNLQKSLLLAGTFGTCLLMIVPIGFSMQMFGAWRTQFAVGLAVSIATGLIPLAASLNFYTLLLVRMVLGLAISNLFPVVAAICTAWAPQAQKGTFLAVLSGYIQLSVIISMPMTGFLCDSFGWPSVFFVHSGLGLLLTVIWAICYRDTPKWHPWIGDHELALIELGKQTQKIGSASKRNLPPYRQILCSVPIWAILCAVAGNFLVIQFANTFLPMFLVSAMHFSNSETGLLSALPLVIQFLVKWLTGLVTDHLPNVSDLIKVRLCNSGAFFGTALFFVLATFFPPDYFPRWPAVLCLTFSIGVLGLNSGGFTKSVVLVSVQYAPAVMAGVQMTLCATIFIGSFLVPAITSQNGGFYEYRLVFWLYAIVLAFTNLVFVGLGKASPAKWTLKPVK